MASHPYRDLPSRAYWRSAVTDAGIYGLRDLWQAKWDLPQDAQFATFGSCFAQHIAGALRERGMAWVDAEPAPAGTPRALARAYHYSIYSARTGNIYTAAQLRLLLEICAGLHPVDAPELWSETGRWRDSLRPAIEPDGFTEQAEALASRRSMLRALRRAIERTDVFIFTLGLTEAWENTAGQVMALCPGVKGGQFDPTRYRFVNYDYGAVLRDLVACLAILQEINPQIRLLLTVSPVPLTATAGGGHVLVATNQSKAVLRAVAGEMAARHEAVDYFPSYEVITGQPARHGFYAPNLREVEAAGVRLVMEHFFAGLRLTQSLRHSAEIAADLEHRHRLRRLRATEAAACDEAALEAFNVH